MLEEMTPRVCLRWGIILVGLGKTSGERVSYELAELMGSSEETRLKYRPREAAVDNELHDVSRGALLVPECRPG